MHLHNGGVYWSQFGFVKFVMVPASSRRQLSPSNRLSAARGCFAFPENSNSPLKDVNPHFAISWKMPIFASGNGEEVY